MKLILSHVTGNANVKAAVNGFAGADLLAEFHVSLATFPGSIIDRIGSIPAFAEIRRRRFAPELKPLTKTYPTREIGRLLALKAGLPALVKSEDAWFNIDRISQSLDSRVASRLKKVDNLKLKGIYGYEDSSLLSFSIAKQLGVKCFYDLPIGYWRSMHRLLERERDRWPDWSSTITGFDDSQEKLARKDEELFLADRIFVASKFTAETLKEFPGNLAAVEVIPYGFPSVDEPRSYSNNLANKPLKLLFVGGLSQRKGIADLFAAVEGFGRRVELTIVGSKVTDNCPALDAALNKHKYIPSLSHENILKLMRQNDVFIFPSLFEGFGLVITEAMSQGTPVITTNRTAGPDLIEDGETGWLVEAGSSEAIKAAIEKLLISPQKISIAGRGAMETARKRPWEVYGRELVEAVKRC